MGTGYTVKTEAVAAGWPANTHREIGKNVKSRGEKADDVLKKWTWFSHDLLRGPVINSCMGRGGRRKRKQQTKLDTLLY